jgi:hypothetical protein
MKVLFQLQILTDTVGPVVMYECESWSLTLWQEHTHTLRVFDKRIPRRIYEPKRQEVTERWRKLHNEELRNLYSPYIIRVESNQGVCDGQSL